MARWLLLAGLVWGIWARDGMGYWGQTGLTQSPAAQPASDVMTMDGCDPFPPK